MLRRPLNIWQRAEGATVIEYAFIVPILLLFLMGILEFSLVMYGRAVLEGAIIAGAREGKTGYNNTTASGLCPSPVVNGSVVPQTQAAFINCYVGTRVNGLFNPANLQISYTDTGSGTFSTNGDATTYPSTCTTVVATPQTPPLCSEGTQNAGDIVVYTVTYPWPIITPLLGNILGSGNGTISITASAMVKNEPYTSSR